MHLNEGIERASRVDGSRYFNDDTGIVSLINIGSTWIGHSVIVIEISRNGHPFVGIYHIAANKLKGVITEIEVDEDYGYFRGFLPHIFKYEFHLKQSKSWVAEARDIQRMVVSIKKKAQHILKAWLENRPYEQYPYRFQLQGAHSLLGTSGADNCATWAEKELVLAYVGNGSMASDSIAAFPSSHTSGFFTTLHRAWNDVRESFNITKEPPEQIVEETPQDVVEGIKRRDPFLSRVIIWADWSSRDCENILAALERTGKRRHWITHVDLSWAQFEEGRLQALENDPTIEEIDLSGTKIRIRYPLVSKIMRTLFSHPLLHIIHLSNTECGNKGAQVLAEALRNPECHLEQLHLNNCNIGNEGAVDFAKAINEHDKKGRKCVKLSLLSLRFNYIRHVGVVALYEAMGKNRRLHVLDLRYNPLCVKCLEAGAVIKQQMQIEVDRGLRNRVHLPHHRPSHYQHLLRVYAYQRPIYQSRYQNAVQQAAHKNKELEEAAEKIKDLANRIDRLDQKSDGDPKLERDKLLIQKELLQKWLTLSREVKIMRNESSIQIRLLERRTASYEGLLFVCEMLQNYFQSHRYSLAVSTRDVNGDRMSPHRFLGIGFVQQIEKQICFERKHIYSDQQFTLNSARRYQLDEHFPISDSEDE